MSDLWVQLLTFAVQSCVTKKLKKLTKKRLETMQGQLTVALAAVTSELDRRAE